MIALGRLWGSCLCFTSLLSVSCVRFHSEPISPEASLDDFEARRLDAPELKEFFQTRQGIAEWPPESWALDTLTLVAFYYHPDLDVARAQWGVASGGMLAAGERPNPAGDVLMGYNSTIPADVVRPWIPEVVLGIPIETAGKRGIRITEARHISEAARWNILTVAWQVRSRLRRAFLELYAAQETESLLTRQQEIQTETVRLLDLQREAGEVSPYQVTQARIALDNVVLSVLEANRRRGQARVQLADALGLPTTALDGATFSFDTLRQILAELPSNEIRRRALVSRSDILGALSEYEAAQAGLQLEIAKQYPDVNIGFGYQLDQTVNKWTLGLGLSLPIASRNKGPIAQADARRTEAAAAFQSLQAKVIGEIESARLSSLSAAESLTTTDRLLTSLTAQEQTAQTAYRLGEISRLELLGVQLQLVSSGLARLDSLVRAQQAIGDLEDAMQSPLEIKEWILEAPERVTLQEGRKDD